MQQLEAIQETSYLSVPNAPVYRRIMRLFFREYEKMHVKLYREDVLELLRREEGYGDYPAEQLELDLAALVRWNNLTPIQDPGRVYTIADYKNKQYTYSMSEAAVEIERMTVRLENLVFSTGSLSSSFLLRLEHSLAQAPDMKKASPAEVGDWWELLQEDFRRLIQNYQDYLRDFYSGRADRLMKSVEFVLHKDRFIQYLTEFVRELQRHSRMIEQTIVRVSPLMEEELLDRVADSLMEIPRANLGEGQVTRAALADNVRGRWESIREWFLDTQGKESECRKVLKITNDIIRSIIQNASLIVQMQNWGISRKDDYRKFLKMFLDCESLDEAHRLSAHVFGIQGVRHLKTLEARDEDGTHTGVYDEAPCAYLLKPHTRAYREKKDRQGFVDRSEEKRIQREKYLEAARREKETALRYIRDGAIDFSRVEETVSEATRQIFLQWIAQANMSAGYRGRTEYGQEYRLCGGEERCVLHCEDGDLVMPAYRMEFTEND